MAVVALLLAACEGSDPRGASTTDASQGGDRDGDSGADAADAAPAIDAGDGNPCACGCVRYTVAPADCTIDWSSALGGGSSLGIDRLVVALDGLRAPHVLDEASCHPSLGGFYASGGVGETVLTLCASTCAAISPDKALLLHPICGY